MNKAIAIAAACIAAIGCAIGGYAIGSASAPTQEDFDAEFVKVHDDTLSDARASAYGTAHARGLQAGTHVGRTLGAQEGEAAGTDAGAGAADEVIAASTPSPPLVKLPNGELGYSLPEDQRSISCIGIEADSGQCVGD